MPSGSISSLLGKIFLGVAAGVGLWWYLDPIGFQHSALVTMWQPLGAWLSSRMR